VIERDFPRITNIKATIHTEECASDTNASAFDTLLPELAGSAANDTCDHWQPVCSRLTIHVECPVQCDFAFIASLGDFKVRTDISVKRLFCYTGEDCAHGCFSLLASSARLHYHSLF